MLYISNKYHPSNNLAKYQYFTLDTLYLSFISKKTGAPHRKHFLKHPLFDIFSPFLTLSGVCNISKNTDFLINQLQKYFYRRHLMLLLHYNKKFALSIVQVFRNIHFLPCLCQLVFKVDELCNISKKYRPPSNIPKHLYFCARDFMSLLYYFKNKLVLSIAIIFRNIHLLSHFHYF